MNERIHRAGGAVAVFSMWGAGLVMAAFWVDLSPKVGPLPREPLLYIWMVCFGGFTAGVVRTLIEESAMDEPVDWNGICFLLTFYIALATPLTYLAGIFPFETAIHRGLHVSTIWIALLTGHAMAESEEEPTGSQVPDDPTEILEDDA